MAKYGFDYFVKRGEVLSEMAAIDKPLVNSTPDSPIGRLAYDLRNQVSAMMQAGGLESSQGKLVPGYPTGNRTNRVLRYFLFTITGMDMDDEIDKAFDPSAELDELSEEAEMELIVKKTKESISAKAREITGVPQDENFKNYYRDMDKMYRAATVKFVKDNPNYIASPEFKEKLLDPRRIADFMVPARTALHSGTSVQKAKALEDLHGMSIEDIHSTEMDILGLVTKIKKEIGYKKTRGVSRKGTVRDPNIPNNKFTKNVDVILKEFEAYEALKKVLTKVLGHNFEKSGNFGVEAYDVIMGFVDSMDTPPPSIVLMSLASMPVERDGSTVMSDIREEFEDLKSTGVEEDEFKEIMAAYIDLFGESNIVLPFLKFFGKYALREVTFGTDKIFAGYPDDVIEKIIQTPEEYQAFAKYHNLEVETRENAAIKKAENAAMKGANDSNEKLGIGRSLIPAMRDGYKLFQAKWEKLEKDRAKKYGDSIRILDADGNPVNGYDPDLDSADVSRFDTDDSAIKTGKKDKKFDPNTPLYKPKGGDDTEDTSKYGNDDYTYDEYGDDNDDIDEGDVKDQYDYDEDDDDDEDEEKEKKKKKKKLKESYVMGYMTEQVQKDNLNNPKGEFKDRGFKKPTNYAQWMMNQ